MRRYLNYLLSREIIFISTVILAVCGIWLFFTFDGNVTGFFRIGDYFQKSRNLAERELYIFKNQAGCDGQFYLSMALDPVLKDQSTIDSLDVPIYRYRRILYPLLGFALSFGVRALIPYVLVGINIASVILIALAVRRYFVSNGLSSRWSLAVLALPAVWVILSLNTADLLASLFFVLAVTTFSGSSGVRCAFWLMLACLTRETMLFSLGAFFIDSVLRRDLRRSAYFVLAGFPCIIWNLYVYLRFEGLYEALPASVWFGIPGKGILLKFEEIAGMGVSLKTGFEAFSFLLLILCFTAVMSSAAGLWRKNRPLLFTAIVYLIIFVCSHIKLLGYYISYYRVFIDIQVMVVLSLCVRPNMFKKLVLAGMGTAAVAYIAAYSMGMI